MSTREIKRSKYDILFDKITKENGYPEPIKKMYNYCVLNHGIPKKVSKTKIYNSRKDTYVTYQNVRYQRPVSSRLGDINPIDILNITGSSYMVDFIADIVRIDRKTGEIIQRLDGAVIFKIPLMLDSEACKLHGKSPQELISMGECPADPFGYFRIKSAEKLIIMQENLRLCRVFIFVNKGDIDCRITLPCKKNTLVIKINIGKHLQSFKVTLGHFFNDCPLPVYGIYYLLARMTAEETTSQILQFIRPEHHERAIMVLTASIEELNNFEISEDTSAVDIRLYKYITSKFKEKLIDLTQDKILAYIQDNLFPNVEGVDAKLLHLSMMTARLVEYMLNLRPLDNRDSWSNKRIETAGRQIEMLFTIMWEQFISQREEHQEMALTDYQATGSYNIGDYFISAFAPSAWGPPKAKKNENIVDYLKRGTHLEVIQQVAKVSTPTSPETKSITLREVSGTQVGYFDPCETVEGPRVGLVKNLCITAQPSREVETKPIISLVKKLEGFHKGYHQNSTCPVLVNGIIIGWIEDELIEETRLILRDYKRRGEIPFDVCILYNQLSNQMEIYCDSSRPVRPLLVVNEKTQELIIDEIDGFDFSIDELLKSGCIEYLDAQEQEFSFIGESPKIMKRKIMKRKKLEQKLTQDLSTEERNIILKDIASIPIYSHCEISPLAQFSIMSSLAPKANHQQGPRTGYQANMGRQALGPLHSVHEWRFDPGFKVGLRTSRPLFDVQTGELVKLGEMPTTVSLVVAFAAQEYNQEDGIIISSDSLHKLRLYKYTTHKFIIQQGDPRGANEKIEFPQVDPSELDKYSALDTTTGLPLPGKYIKGGDFILGKVRRDEYGTTSNHSVSFNEMEKGYVDRVLVEQQNSQIIVKVKIRNLHEYNEGDKMAGRYSQKGIVAKILKPEEMPTVVGGPNDGVKPDLIVSSLSIISRMTQGFLIEHKASKAAVYCGERTDGTSYAPIFGHGDSVETTQELVIKDFERIAQILEENGMNPDGTEILMDPKGNLLRTPYNFGIIAYMKLRHQADGKYQIRGTGTNQIQTQQPVSGRSRGGGIRFGEMERDSQLSAGSSACLLESLFIRSDFYQMPLCVKCGVPPTYFHSYSQSAPIYRCNICRENNFCLVSLPCGQKYLSQILGGLNIKVAYDLKLLPREEINYL